MKFIVFRKVKPEDYEALRAKMGEWVNERKQHPEQYGRYMRLHDGTAASFTMVGKSGGCALMEFDNTEQMQNTVQFWNHMIQYTFVPIVQTERAQTKKI